jgi:hypothetical protein
MWNAKTVIPVIDFIRRWGALATGVLTVPFTLIGLYSDPQLARTIWFSLAGGAFLIAIVLEHSKQAARIHELENKLTRRLKLCYAHDVIQHHGTWAQTFLRVKKEGALNIEYAQVKLIRAQLKKTADGTTLRSSPAQICHGVPNRMLSQQGSMELEI